ncbi:MAG: TIGR04086 family membrane protein [Ruminiclostridium sp.]
MSFRKSSPPFMRRFRVYILGAVIGCLVTVAASVLLAVVMLLLGADKSFSGFMGLLALGCGCLAAGITVGKFRRRSGLKCGIKAALIMLFLCLVGTLFSGNFTGAEVFSKSLVAVLTGGIGGIIGVNKGAPPVW